MPANDFRFLSGHFQVSHRRLAERLVGSEEWAEFQTELWGYPVMGGAAFVDEMRGDVGDGEFWGLTLRLHHPKLDEWSLYWADTWRPELCPPLRGSFAEGRGEFLGVQEENGLPILARFIWSEISELGASWEQAFSSDEGQTWETNWTMRFERIAGSSQRAPTRAF